MNVTVSSPLSPPPASQPSGSASLRQYRSTRDLPFELAQHVQVYFEESMFTQGFRLLNSIISADSSASSGSITVPAPLYLAVASTLSVHPSLTTRTTIRDKKAQSTAALRLLRLLLNTAGPVNTNFARAFTFTRYNNHRRPIGGNNHGEQAEADSDLRSYYAEEGSLWSQAEDFWAVVGWIMNCACLGSSSAADKAMYTARWECWSLWLEFMLECLETDWRLHSQRDTCEESLLWLYIELAPGGNTRARRMLRAIFADGTTASMNEFRPIFRRELKEPPSDIDKPKKREVDVDVDAEIYGDYQTKDNIDSDSSSENEASNYRLGTKRIRRNTPSRRPTPKSSNQSLRSDFSAADPQSANNATSSTTLGPPQSLAFRVRLLNLLLQVASHTSLTAESPTTFPSVDDLLTLYIEFIRPLPLSTFQQMILLLSTLPPPSSSPSDSNNITLLFELLLQRIIEASAPSIHSDDTPLTQTRLETEYLPFAASKATVNANCRVSLLLEILIRHLKQTQQLILSDSLLAATDKGIRRRLEIVKNLIQTSHAKNSNNTQDENSPILFSGNGDGKEDKGLERDLSLTEPNKKRKRKGVIFAEEEIAYEWLADSGERIRLLCT